MNGRPLKVLNIGTDWFVAALEAQGTEVRRIDWSPPVENPADIAAILARIRHR
jgi:hypothetical protein